jgi:hypothetical protein
MRCKGWHRFNGTEKRAAGGWSWCRWRLKLRYVALCLSVFAVPSALLFSTSISPQRLLVTMALHMVAQVEAGMPSAHCKRVA